MASLWVMLLDMISIYLNSRQNIICASQVILFKN